MQSNRAKSVGFRERFEPLPCGRAAFSEQSVRMAIGRTQGKMDVPPKSVRQPPFCRPAEASSAAILVDASRSVIPMNIFLRVARIASTVSCKVGETK